MNPTQVLGRPVSIYEQDMMDQEEIDSLKVPVAKLNLINDPVKGQVWQFFELLKNRLFTSKEEDAHAAYHEFRDMIKQEKESKLFEAEMVRDKNIVTMVQIMKCCIIAYVDSRLLNQMCTFDPEDLNMILEGDNAAFDMIVNAYFKTGCSLGIVVNYPKRTYEECLDIYSYEIKHVLAGISSLASTETEMYKKAFDMLNKTRVPCQ